MLRTMMTSNIHRATVTRTHQPRVTFVDADNRISGLGSDPAEAPHGSRLLRGSLASR